VVAELLEGMEALGLASVEPHRLEWLTAQARFEDARQLLAGLAEQGVDPTWLAKRQARLHVDQGRVDGAVERLDSEIESIRRSTQADLETVAPSERYLRVQEGRSRTFDLLLTKQMIQQGAAQGASAEATLRELLELRPEDPFAQNSLAYLLAVEVRSLDNAEALVLRALEQRPFSGAFLDTLAWVYFRQGRLEEASETIDAALHLLPDDEELLGHRARIREVMESPRRNPAMSP